MPMVLNIKEHEQFFKKCVQKMLTTASTVRMAADGRVFGGFAEKIYSLTCETTVDFHIMYFDAAMQGR